jgi:hypothetical protein
VYRIDRYSVYRSDGRRETGRVRWQWTVVRKFWLSVGVGRGGVVSAGRQWNRLQQFAIADTAVAQAHL